MITINGFLHRARLADLIRRWLFDELHEGDVDELLRLVHFNNVYVSRYLAQFSQLLFGSRYGADVRCEHVTTKGALRDRICTSLPAHCPRCAALAGAYTRNPGQYFRDTPFQGTLYFHPGAGYAGSSRIKRIRRLSEKSARRLVDWLHDSIEPQCIDSHESLQRTEQLLIAQLLSRRTASLPDSLAINDVAGIKLVQEHADMDKLLRLLQHAGCRLVEQERHSGDYCATNLVVEYRPDRNAILDEPLHPRLLRIFDTHGYTPQQANTAFRDFVQSAGQTVNVEIIVTSYAEMLESEIGRCMHEERIIRQRHNPRYYGQLAQNAGFLLEFLFTVPALPLRRLERLPLRIQDRYLPDYFDEVRRRLFNNPSVELNEL